MKPDGDERSKRMAEVLRLHLTEGKGIKAIARQLKLHRKTVRKLLGHARGERNGQCQSLGSSWLVMMVEDMA
jgi:DNA-binding transcriptional regulator LsrR (DeoR family)